MALKEFLIDIDAEIAVIQSTDFEIDVIETKYVPNFDDQDITYDNLDTNKKKCKLLESCVLYVDIRDSAKVSASSKPKTLAKMYSSFVRSMIACARYYGGHVRNIIGDRVMVVFDTENCFKSALDTAVLMNTVSSHILNKHIKNTNFKCGIGIDFGKMLITKSGAVRHGAEKEFYRGLVWLGKPANIASRLTDLANKKLNEIVPVINQGNYYRYTDKWFWTAKSYENFIDDLQVTYTRNLTHKDEYFCSFFKSSIAQSREYSPILMTHRVYDGLKKEHPEADYLTKNMFSKKTMDVRDYVGDVYGGDVIFPIVKEI